MLVSLVVTTSVVPLLKRSDPESRRKCIRRDHPRLLTFENLPLMSFMLLPYWPYYKRPYHKAISGCRIMLHQLNMAAVQIQLQPSIIVCPAHQLHCQRDNWAERWGKSLLLLLLSQHTAANAWHRHWASVNNAHSIVSQQAKNIDVLLFFPSKTGRRLGALVTSNSDWQRVVSDHWSVTATKRLPISMAGKK